LSVSRQIYGLCVSQGHGLKAQYIHQLVPCVSPGAAAPCPSMFVGDVEPMNVARYICQCHIIDECILYLLIPMNTLGYIRRLYIHRCVHRLADKFTLFVPFSIIFVALNCVRCAGFTR
jgi:hypothetical protein